jgi:hypothetical protein
MQIQYWLLVTIFTKRAFYNEAMYEFCNRNGESGNIKVGVRVEPNLIRILLIIHE